MKREFSPEERLLRLIRKPAKRGGPSTGQPEAAANTPAAATPAAVQTPLPAAGKASAQRADAASAAPVKASALNTGRGRDKVRALNIALAVLLAGLVLFFIVDLAFFSKPYDIRSGTPAVTEGESNLGDESALRPKDYSYYSAAISGRNIFTAPEDETAAVAAGPSIDEVMAGLSLLGVIEGDRPQAIIEDKATGKSYFLYEGGAIGNAKVVSIGDGEVSLEYQGQTFELYL